MAGNISTRAGDKGPTDIGGGERVDKDDVRVECLGDLDEANTAIGL
jgi:cob(I)alamin adenosyltransferase